MEEETKPLPFTVSVKPGAPAFALDGERLLSTGAGAAVVLNVAATVVSAFNVTVHVAAPLQPPPLHAEKVEPEAAAAVRMTLVPATAVSVQALPHEIPAGVLVTVPVPGPFRVTTSVALAKPATDPVTVRETVSPFAVKFTLLAKLPTVVERMRTITA
jgi:hypothetical protein